MYCSNCGHVLKETDIFCSQCGHKVSTPLVEKQKPEEEVVFNRREKEPVFHDHIYEERLKTARKSVEKAKSPREDDFIWNVHQFPDAERPVTEDIDFRWDQEPEPEPRRYEPEPRRYEPEPEKPLSEDKFHTYNKSREEFQKLLDKEYLKINQGFAFDPEKHLRETEEQREIEAPFKPFDYWDNETFVKSEPRFDTRELQKDLFKQEIPEADKTQLIEKIVVTEVEEDPVKDDFEITKTQYVVRDKSIVAPTILPQVAKDEEIVQPMEPEIIAPTVEAAEDGPVEMKEIFPESTPEPDVDEKLSRLWDTDTAPVPVSSIPLQVARDYEAEEREEEEEYLGGAYYYEEPVKKGSFIGKLFIAIIIVVLIIEGSILGLRYFAPETEVTNKVNGILTEVQHFVEDKILKK